jgi:hypothetical protein
VLCELATARPRLEVITRVCRGLSLNERSGFDAELKTGTLAMNWRL